MRGCCGEVQGDFRPQRHGQATQRVVQRGLGVGGDDPREGDHAALQYRGSHGGQDARHGHERGRWRQRAVVLSVDAIKYLHAADQLENSFRSPCNSIK
jgi:hypothetical protein